MGTVRLPSARPFAFRFEPVRSALLIIDMQRDFIEPGGFGESLGNEVTRLQAILPTARRVLEAWRDRGGFVVHTREAHQSDLSDCPPAKRERGSPALRIDDAGPMGRILIAGQPSNAIVEALRPAMTTSSSTSPARAPAMAPGYTPRSSGAACVNSSSWASPPRSA
jgi:nicotinamidase-related amidase